MFVIYFIQVFKHHFKFIFVNFIHLFFTFSKRKLNVEGYKSDKANQGKFKTSMEAFASINDIKIYQAEDFFIDRFKNYLGYLLKQMLLTLPSLHLQSLYLKC